jgi:crossover junction endodeoxyribonuclease RusA
LDSLCPNSFTFTVLGKPAPQGSKRHVGRGILLESSKRCKPWRQDVKYAALEALPDGWYAMMDKPILVSVTFIFARPKGHFRTNGELKPKAPSHCTARVGDTDKLCRSILDALSNSVFSDDSQVIALNAQKRYATRNEQPSAIITIAAIS